MALGRKYVHAGLGSGNGNTVLTPYDFGAFSTLPPSGGQAHNTIFEFIAGTYSNVISTATWNGNDKVRSVCVVPGTSENQVIVRRNTLASADVTWQIDGTLIIGVLTASPASVASTVGWVFDGITFEGVGSWAYDDTIQLPLPLAGPAIPRPMILCSGRVTFQNCTFRSAVHPQLVRHFESGEIEDLNSDPVFINCKFEHTTPSASMACGSSHYRDCIFETCGTVFPQNILSAQGCQFKLVPQYGGGYQTDTAVLIDDNSAESRKYLYFQQNTIIGYTYGLNLVARTQTWTCFITDNMFIDVQYPIARPLTTGDARLIHVLNNVAWVDSAGLATGAETLVKISAVYTCRYKTNDPDAVTGYGSLAASALEDVAVSDVAYIGKDRRRDLAILTNATPPVDSDGKITLSSIYRGRAGSGLVGPLESGILVARDHGCLHQDHCTSLSTTVLSGTRYGRFRASAGNVVLPTAAQVLNLVAFGPAGASVGNVVLPTAAQVLNGVAFGPASATIGTVVLPTIAQVLNGVAFGPGSALTGNVVVPIAAAVFKDYPYGPASATLGTLEDAAENVVLAPAAGGPATYGYQGGKTGNVTLPTESQTLLGVLFGPASALEGNVILPETAVVLVTIHYGPLGSLTGQYAEYGYVAAAMDPDDVRLGVRVGHILTPSPNGAPEGTIIMPSEATVLLGTEYDANGERVGTYDARRNIKFVDSSAVIVEEDEVPPTTWTRTDL